jgi:GTPase SAR1 family protein
MSELKILVVGPPKSGKTEIADILSAASKCFQGNCKPTVGLRVLEFSQQVAVASLQATLSVQLWDTSGDERYQMTWPAIAKNADGAVIVYNATDKVSGRAAENYAKIFCKDLTPSQVIVVAHRIGEVEGKPLRAKLPAPFDKIAPIIVNAQNSLDNFNDPFAAFLAAVQQAKTERIEAEERRLIGVSQPEPSPAAPAKKGRPRKSTEPAAEPADGGDAVDVGADGEVPEAE